MKLNPLPWLFGFRILEKDEDHVLIRLPVWCGSEEGKRKIATRILADDVLKNPDKKPLKIETGYRLMRFEREK